MQSTGILLDVAGTQLNATDEKILQHEQVAGVILFTRNYENPQQLAALTQAIRKAAGREILITVDHEGGRVQRFREGFSAIPAMARIAEYSQSPARNAAYARELGWLMASELLACGVDHSFAPVLDLHGPSSVIGDRAFGPTSEAIVPLAAAFIRGMHEAGMRATGKHFPGHGTVVADSHIDIPVDDRSLNEILHQDTQPFIELLPHLQALMPAHVIYPQVDPDPAGFSIFWMQQILRQDLDFQGVIISDDLLMAGATVAGTVSQRAEKALAAGCDLLLVCNDQTQAQVVLDTVDFPASERDPVQALRGQSAYSSLAELQQSQRWQDSQTLLTGS